MAASAVPSRGFGFALLIGVALGWGLNWPAMKLIVGEVPPWQFRAVTGAAGAVLLLGLARVLRQPLAVPREQWLPLVAASLLNVTSWFVLIAYGVKLMASGHASILGFTMPIWAAVIGMAALGERMSTRRFVSLAMGIAGVVVLLSHDFAALGASPIGALITLVGAFNWAIGVHIQKRVKWAVEPLVLAGWQVALGTLPIVVIALFAEPFVYHRASWPVIGATVYLVLYALAFCYYAWFNVVRIFPTHISAIGSLLVPIVGVASSSLFLGEPFGWREIAALVLVVGAVALVMIQPPERPAAAPSGNAPAGAAARGE
ncbi:MAG: DMT family transporter [Alphaproteobacteria bacterium]